MASGHRTHQQCGDPGAESPPPGDQRRADAAARHAGQLLLLYSASEHPNINASEAAQAALLALATRTVSYREQYPEPDRGAVLQPTEASQPAREGSKPRSDRESPPRPNISVGTIASRGTDPIFATENTYQETVRGRFSPEGRRAAVSPQQNLRDSVSPEKRRGATPTQPVLGSPSPSGRRSDSSQTRKGVSLVGRKFIEVAPCRPLAEALPPASRRGACLPVVSNRSSSRETTPPGTASSSGPGRGSGLWIREDPYKVALSEARSSANREIQEGKDQISQRYPGHPLQSLLDKEDPHDRLLQQTQTEIQDASRRLENIQRRLRSLRPGVDADDDDGKEPLKRRRANLSEIRRMVQGTNDPWDRRETVQQELQRLVGCATDDPDTEHKIWQCTCAIAQLTKTIANEDKVTWQHGLSRRADRGAGPSRPSATQRNQKSDNDTLSTFGTGGAGGPSAEGGAAQFPPARQRAGREHSPSASDARDEDDNENPTHKRPTFPSARSDRKAKKRSLTELSMQTEAAGSGQAGKGGPGRGAVAGSPSKHHSAGPSGPPRNPNGGRGTTGNDAGRHSPSPTPAHPATTASQPQSNSPAPPHNPLAVDPASHVVPPSNTGTGAGVPNIASAAIASALAAALAAGIAPFYATAPAPPAVVASTAVSAGLATAAASSGSLPSISLRSPGRDRKRKLPKRASRGDFEPRYSA